MSSKASASGRGRGTAPTTVVRLGLLLVAGLVVAACGTRLPDEAFVPEERVISSSDTTDPTGSDDDDDDRTTSTTGVSVGTDGGREASDTVTAADASDQSSGERTTGGDEEAGPNQASDTGVTEATIRIGNITAENGVLGDAFAPAVRGLRAWVQFTNANGGVHGREIELFTCDDREDRARTLECARRLVEQDEVFALVATNTRSMGGASQYLADQGIPVIGFPINNAFFRYPNFFSIYGTGYERDGTTVGVDNHLVNLSGQYRWFKQNLGLEKAAVFYYDIAESAQAGDFMAAGLEAEGFEVWRFAVSFAAPSFDTAVAELEEEGISLVYDAMDDGANRRLCDSMARRQYEPTAKVSTVVVMGDAVGSNYNDTCRNSIYIVNQSLPYTAGATEIAEFRREYARYQPGLPLHQWAMEAWAIGNITQDALASMGPAPTRAGFIEYLDTMEPHTADGIMVGTSFTADQIDFDAPTNENCFAIARWLDAEGGWVEASSPFPFCYADAKTFRTKAAEQGN